jgi:REP element-mobilizing transposase RayT
MDESLISYRRWLPHWRMSGAVYFVTWRCHPDSRTLNPAEREVVLSALRHFEGLRYRLFAYVAMDDHVHAVVQPLKGFALEALLHSWKSFTANAINRLRGRTGPVWQKEYFDRIVRDEDEFFEKCQYILNNPLKRWPELKEYPWAGLVEANFS